VQSGSRQVTGEMASLEQSQNDMSASLGQAIAGVQSETRQVAVDVTAVTAEQTKLYEVVQESNVQMNDKVAVMEQTELERQDTIGGMQENIQAVAVSISALGEDMLRLQEILQSNIRELVSIADITSGKQLEFQESLKTDLQTLDESLASLKTSQSAMQSRIQQMQNDAPDFSDVPAALDQLRVSQSALQSRIEQMQNDAPDFGDMPAALDQLRDQLEELSRSSEVDEVSSTEYDSPPQANSIE
jgi:DNA repair exonuclease SbcCD ATPase subunit